MAREIHHTCNRALMDGVLHTHNSATKRRVRADAGRRSRCRRPFTAAMSPMAFGARD
jgi:hypothetical protein